MCIPKYAISTVIDGHRETGERIGTLHLPFFVDFLETSCNQTRMQVWGFSTVDKVITQKEKSEKYSSQRRKHFLVTIWGDKC